MKKSISLLLAAMMLLFTTVSLGEAPTTFTNEASGITFILPDGFIAEDASTEDTTALVLAEDANPDVVYIYELYYSETLDGMWMEDLTEEQVEIIAQGMVENVGDLNYTSVEVDGITYMLLHNADNTFACIISLLNGWTCALYAMDVNGEALPDTIWDSLDTLQMSIVYNEAAPEE